MIIISILNRKALDRFINRKDVIFYKHTYESYGEILVEDLDKEEIPFIEYLEVGRMEMDDYFNNLRKKYDGAGIRSYVSR